TLAAILRDPVPPLKSARPDVPAAVEGIVGRSLEKDPADRYPSAVEMRSDLAACRAVPAAPAVRVPPQSRRRGLIAGLSLLTLAPMGALAGSLVGESRVRRAREALAQISILAEANRGIEAFRLARESEPVLPEDVGRLTRTWSVVSVTTEPQGAEVSV